MLSLLVQHFFEGLQFSQIILSLFIKIFLQIFIDDCNFVVFIDTLDNFIHFCLQIIDVRYIFLLLLLVLLHYLIPRSQVFLIFFNSLF